MSELLRELTRTATIIVNSAVMFQERADLMSVRLYQLITGGHKWKEQEKIMDYSRIYATVDEKSKEFNL